MTALIAAYDKNRVIGYNGKIPWNIKDELKRYKELTTGNVVIMGRRSFEEIGAPLPNRINIVVSTTKNFSADNCFTVKSLGQAIKTAEEKAPGKNIYISGGAGLFAQAIEFVEKMYITEIDAEFKGDVFFPEFDRTLFDRQTVKSFPGDIPYTYYTYTRKK